MMMQLAAVAAVGALALAGCQATAVDDAIAARKQQIESICRAEPAVHAAFIAIADAGKVSARVRRTEVDAHAAVTAICADIPTDTFSTFTSLLSAYSAVLAAQASIKE